jgi:hypothetical protein
VLTDGLFQPGRIASSTAVSVMDCEPIALQLGGRLVIHCLSVARAARSSLHRLVIGDSLAQHAFG